MHYPFPSLDYCVVVQKQENYDPNGKHLEYRNVQGELFGRMTKMHKKGSAFAHLFDVFKSAQDITAELRDNNNELLLATTSLYGSTKRECRVDVFQPDGTLFGHLYDANFGADFTLPDDTLVGTARRPEDRPTEPMEVIHTYANADGVVVGTSERSYPNASHGLWDFLENGGYNSTGLPVQTVKIEAGIDPILQTFLFLFPSLQHLRYSKSS